jgi:hypothetical protein
LLHGQLAAGQSPSDVVRQVGWMAAPQVRFAIDSPLEGDGFEPSVPREGVKGQGPQFHADYPPIGWARKQRMKRMLNGFKRYGITCPAQTRCQPDRLI